MMDEHESSQLPEGDSREEKTVRWLIRAMGVVVAVIVCVAKGQGRDVFVTTLAWTSMVSLGPILWWKTFKDWRAWCVLAVEVVVHILLLRLCVKYLVTADMWGISLIAIPEMLVASFPFVWIVRDNETAKGE